MADNKNDNRAAAFQWNMSHPKGTRVRVRLANGDTFEAKTASHAQQWGGMGLLTLGGHQGTWTKFALTPIE